MKNIKRYNKVTERNYSGRNKKWLVLVIFILCCITGFSQNPVTKVFEDWRDTAGTQNTFYKAVTRTIPGTTNILVAGATLNSSGNYDMLVEKLNGAGGIVWSQQYDGAGHGDDAAFDLQVDGAGYVYITGTYYQDATDSNNAITIKYNSSGVQQWAETFNGTGSGFDATAGLYIDNSNGDVYAVGSEWEGGSNFHDILLLKYGHTGSLQWSTTLDYMNGDDGAYKVTSSGGKIYVTGAAQSAPLTYDYALVVGNKSNGAAGIDFTSSGSALGISKITDIVVDDSSNVYITGGVLNGGTLYDFRTIKLDSSLTLKWSNDFDAGYNLNDLATGIALDSLRNVIVVGSSETVFNGKDYAVVKYDNNGGLQWLRFFNGTANGDDSATAIVVSPSDTNKIYVTGYSYNGSTKDYYTMRYDGAGNSIWEIGFNSLQNGDDAATAIALDTLGGIIVTGQVKLADTTFNFSTVKYMEKKTILPMDTIAATSNSFIYTENEGQLLGTDSMQHSEIRFYVLKGGPQVYFTDTSVSYVFAKLDTSRTSHIDTLCRVDMKFKGSNSTKIRAMDIRADYENFFFPYIPEGRSDVHNYNQLVSFNVWNNIDVEYGSNMKGMKYYFICKPSGGGGTYSNVDLKYNGADSVKIDASGQLIIYTKLGNIVQPKAAAWQIDAYGNYSSLGWQPSYNIIATNEVKFTSLGLYNTAFPLIIAIDWGNNTVQSNTGINWSTFYGGGNYDQFHDIHVTSTGEVVVCGQSASSLPFAFPTTAGVVFPSHVGGNDAVVAKFFPGGTREWATYYGGSAGESANAIDVDASNQIFFTGTTQSTNFPLQTWNSAYYQSSYGGTRDMFMVALSPSGQNKIWSTYYGGPNDDLALDLKISPINGDIYLVGAAAAGFPLNLTGAYNSSTGGGAIVRFNSLGNSLWSTKFGPIPGYVFIQSITIDALGDIVTVGHLATDTAGFPTTIGCAQPTYGGGAFEGFVTKFSGTANGIMWSTFFGGTGNENILSVDHSGSDVSTTYYITGWTTGGSFPLLNPGNNAYYQSSYGGNTDAFVAQFDYSGAILWSSYYGGSDHEQGNDITLDADNNIFITGYTKSTNLPLPSPNLSNAYVASSITGTQDAFVSCFQKYDRKHIWSTYYGGSPAFEESDAIDHSGDTAIYIAGMATTSSNFPLNQGSSTAYGNRYYDGNVNGTKGFISMLNLSDVILADVTETSTNQFNFTVYPNPATNDISISADLDTKQEIVIEIFDLTGQVIRKEKISATMRLNTQIDVSSLADGVYLVRLSTENKSLTKKIVIQQ